MDTSPKPSFADLTPVESTNIHSFGYDPSAQALRIRFHSGSVYDYLGVDQATADAFSQADSKGRFHGQTIRGKFKAELVEAKGDKKPAAEEQPQAAA